jgi:hypothetical protein
VTVPALRTRIHRLRWSRIFRHWALILTLAVLGVASSLPMVAPAETNQATTDDRVFWGIRILKEQQAGNLSWSVDLPASCRQCRVELNRFSSGQNAREFFFHFWAPRNMAITGVHVKVDPSQVRGVLVALTDVELEKNDYSRPEHYALGSESIRFRSTNGGINFDVPAHPSGPRLPPDDPSDVTEFCTYIETPGLYVRVGHADPLRRRGGYVAGQWPAVEAAAAVNLEFAAREAVTELGLDRTLRQWGVEKITIMNFDTNYPTLGEWAAHDDWPPHWHMHLYWSSKPRVRKVGHFYIAADGLLTENLSSTLKLDGKADEWYAPWYERGESDPTTTPNGMVLYTQTITPDGYFELSSSSGTCRFVPAKMDRGFDSGVNLSCSGHAPIEGIQVEDDISRGFLTLYMNRQLVQQYQYDPDTGRLVN